MWSETPNIGPNMQQKYDSIWILSNIVTYFTDIDCTSSWSYPFVMDLETVTNKYLICPCLLKKSNS